MREETNFEELYYQKCAQCEMFVDAMVCLNNALKNAESSLRRLQQELQELVHEYDSLKEENENLEAENDKLRKENKMTHEFVPDKG